MSTIADRRRSGLLIPLFSCPSSKSWGIGDIGDVKPMTAWLAAAGLQVMQLLPLNEMAPGQQSPYSALSAMAIDPIFICLADVPDFTAVAHDAVDADELARVRASPYVNHPAVRALKERALMAAFQRFLDAEWNRQTERAQALKAYLDAESWWVDDYALFRAIHAYRDHQPWMEWPEALRARDPIALEDTRRRLERDVLYRQYLQWVADTQWRAARAAARDNGVALFGDLPFMVDGDSADVWARQHDFRLDASVGVPPDAFSATGQDWGMPPYEWDAIGAGDFQWLKNRARRNTALYDGYRVDHLVGFYRTYSRPKEGGAPSFSPELQADQQRLGERALAIFTGPGAEVVAEDLGVVPDFVRASLAKLGVPGCRVFRWERFWTREGHPFCDPTDYPVISVAVSGTHDTETMAVWWDGAPEDERLSVAALPTVQNVAPHVDFGEAYTPSVRDALLETLFAARSNLLLMPVQDVFGWRERINEPGTVTLENWTFRLPWPCDQLDDQAEARERQAALRLWGRTHGRTAPVR